MTLQESDCVLITSLQETFYKTPKFPFVLEKIHLQPLKEEDNLSTRDRRAQFYIAPLLTSSRKV